MSSLLVPLVLGLTVLLFPAPGQAQPLPTGLLEAAFAGADRLAAAHASARELSLQSITVGPIPLHVAAARFFQERGIALPDRLVSAR